MKKLLVLGLLIALFMVVSPVLAASISTDQSDYSPEMTVTITGTGFTPGDFVYITVTRPTTPPTVEAVEQYPVTTKPDGTFIVTYQLDGIQGNYYVDAKDSVGSVIAPQITFTDAAAANVNFAASGLPAGTSVPVTYSGTNNGNNPISNPPLYSFLSPGPSADIGTLQGSQFTYAFQSSIIAGTDTYNLQSSSPSSPVTTNAGSPPIPAITITAIYLKATPVPTPEFPTMALPATFIVGLLGAILFIKSSKED